MRIETEERGAHRVLRLMGGVSMGEPTQALSEALIKAENESAGAIIVDLSDVRSLDSTGLGLLAGSLRRLHQAGRELILIKPNERVALLLSMTQLDTLIPVHDTSDEAFDALERMTGGVTDRDVRSPNRPNRL